MAFPLDRSKYVEVGAAKGLDFIDELAPATVYDKCNWQCKHCGLKYHKTYRAVYLGAHGCRCQNTMSIPIERYQELAAKYGIQLITKANNYKEPSKWYSPMTDKFVEMSYYQMVNAPLQNAKLFQELGITLYRNNEPFDMNTAERKFRKVKFIINGKEIEAEGDKIKELEKVLKIEKERQKMASKYRLLNQEEEQEGYVQEVYDN